MKKLILCMVLIAGITQAQKFYTFEQVFRNDNSGANGSTWAASATHYSDFIDMRDVDSAWIVVNFPDSVDVGIFVENYTSTDGVVYLSSAANASDSTIYTTDNTGISEKYSLVGYYQQGFPLIRLKSVFSAIDNTLVLSAKYKYYIFKFKHQ
jgi:hypothetical protein